ncbi:40S ribosomal protein S13 [Tupaia chinensis]|uniref:Small ribosomal subunit protein uS15 n=1 Tax=Tupaia chinensis TaxID=246437 RepID=L9KK85_TUPCH|nr:40S ribosomal protein S13 [Tupaia chinensis]
MGCTHAPGKALSQSTLPYLCSVPMWLKLISHDMKELIYKLAKKGLTLSQIGMIPRDSHGVVQVRFVTGNKILRIFKYKGLAPDLPEELSHLIKKAVAVRKHLEKNRKDKGAKFHLILIESRIHQLARYHKTKQVLPTTGNVSHPQPLPWLHKFVYSSNKIIV